MKKKNVVLLVFAIFVVVVLAASVVLTSYWANMWHIDYLKLSKSPYRQEQIIAYEEFKYFITFLIFTILQALALSFSTVCLIYIIKTDFTLTKQEREARDAARQAECKQAKKAKLQAKLDELNK